MFGEDFGVQVEDLRLAARVGGVVRVVGVVAGGVRVSVGHALTLGGPCARSTISC